VLDLDEVVLLGHSAGGTLALWLASQPLDVRVRLIVAVAPVADLVKGLLPRRNPMASRSQTTTLPPPGVSIPRPIKVRAPFE